MMQNWLLIEKKNMANRILVDTNVLLDYVLMRENFCKDAKSIFLACANGNVNGCIAAHSISNMFLY